MDDLYFLRLIKYCCKKIIICVVGKKNWLKYKYRKTFNKRICFSNPQTINEKIYWLKLNHFENFYYKCCDKYLLHDYLLEKTGFDYAVPLECVFSSYKDIDIERINEYPCIMKVSNSSGANLIIKSKDQYSTYYLRNFFKKQLLFSKEHAIDTVEKQYDIKHSYIVVEKLLTDLNGNVPNDYKFLFSNGKLQFIYCSVDRFGENVRQIYNDKWERLHFIWASGANQEKYNKYEKSKSIPKPLHFDKMLEIANKLSKDFIHVRIDFYDMEDSFYIGEITLHHASGNYKFYPEKYDKIYGDLLVLPDTKK